MPDDLVAPDPPIGFFRFTLAPVQPLEVPTINKGNMLRGGFGHAFRRLCCVSQCKDAKTCPLTASCPYKAVFEPSPPPGADRLSKNQDIPRPFVFRAPPTQQTRFEPGQLFEFGLVLIGCGLDFLPYFVLSFRELAAEGLGLNRARCKLEQVEQIKPFSNGAGLPDHRGEIVYTAEDQLLRAVEVAITDEWVRSRLRNISAREKQWCLSMPHNSVRDAYIPARGWRGDISSRLPPPIQAAPRPNQCFEHLFSGTGRWTRIFPNWEDVQRKYGR